MGRIDDRELVEAKAAVSARLASVRLGRWHLRRVDRRLETYCAAVIRDSAGHNLWEQLAVEHFLNMCGRYGLDAERVQMFFRFYEALTFPGAVGPAHYRLTPVQAFQFASVFGFWEGERRVVREAVLYVPRKFSKTTSSAAFSVWDLLFGEANAESYIGANSADQAKKCFDVIRSCVGALDPGGQYFTVNEQAIRCRIKGREAVKAQCLTANARTKDGLNASVVIMDEFSQARDAGLLNVLTTSMGTRLNPLTVIITTASEVYTGPFYQMLGGYKRLLLDEAAGHGGDDSVFVHLFEPDLGDAEDSEATWAKVQPHLGVTVRRDYYRTEWRKACRGGAEALTAFRTKLLNVYATDAGREWITRAVAERAVAPVPPVWPDGTVAMVAIDMSRCDDLTAITAAYYNKHTCRIQLVTDYFFPEGALAGHVDEELYRRWAAEGHLHLMAGPTVDYRELVAHVDSIAARVPVMGIGYDAYGAKDLENTLRALRYAPVLKAIPQGYGYFKAVFFLEKYIKDGYITINGNPINLWCFENCVLCENAMGCKPEKRRHGLKIDGAITMLMASRLLMVWER